MLLEYGNEVQAVFDMDKAKEIITRLHETPPEKWVSVVHQLDKLSAEELTPEQGIYLLREAATFGEAGIYWFHDASNRLVWRCVKKPYPEYIPVVVDVFPKLSAAGRMAALIILRDLNSPESAQALVDVIQRFGRTLEMDVGSLAGLEEKPLVVRVLFPALLEYLDMNKLGPKIQVVLNSAIDKGTLKVSTLEASSNLILRMFKERLESLGVRQADKDFMRGEHYAVVRFEFEQWLKTVRFLKGHRMTEAYRAVLDQHDEYLRCQAALGLMAEGEEVSQPIVNGIAANLEARNTLYLGLKHLGKEDLFPEEYEDQDSFAESEMVRWLAFGTEMGRAPDEIEIEAVFADEGWEVYLFRFRILGNHWAAEKGWMAGIAGPYRENELKAEPPGGTFSKFEPWDSRTPEEHLEDMLHNHPGQAK